jgi:hypothetical protein
VQVRLSQAIEGILAALASEVLGRGLTLPTQVSCTVSGDTTVPECSHVQFSVIGAHPARFLLTGHSLSVSRRNPLAEWRAEPD